MVKETPSKLYKFQSFKSENSIKNLRKGEIWYSKPEGLNDPFDCAIPFTFTYSEEDMITVYRNYFPEELKKSSKSEYLPNGKPSPELISQTENARLKYLQPRRKEISQMGVACFTTELNSILMWSHYADGHKGFCLEFDTNYFLPKDKYNFKEVIYDVSFPILSPLDIFRSPQRLHEPLFTKSTDWKHENEWRLIVKQGNRADKYDPKALTAIYFGCWTLKENIEKIATLPAKSAATLYQMQPSETEFKLEQVPYHP